MGPLQGTTQTHSHILSDVKGNLAYPIPLQHVSRWENSREPGQKLYGYGVNVENSTQIVTQAQEPRNLEI